MKSPCGGALSIINCPLSIRKFLPYNIAYSLRESKGRMDGITVDINEAGGGDFAYFCQQLLTLSTGFSTAFVRDCFIELRSILSKPGITELFGMFSLEFYKTKANFFAKNHFLQ